jgi:hypothetical protein
LADPSGHRDGRRPAGGRGGRRRSCEAAAAIDLPFFALRTGGFGADELVSAGAARVLDSSAELQQTLSDLLLVDVKLDR